MVGFSFTFPGAYTPCVFPNEAATVKLPIGFSVS